MKKRVAISLIVSMMLSMPMQVMAEDIVGTGALPDETTVYGSVSHQSRPNPEYSWGNVEVTIEPEDAAKKIILDYSDGGFFGAQFSWEGSGVSPNGLVQGNFMIINNTGFTYRVTDFHVGSLLTGLDRMYNEAAVALIGAGTAANREKLKSLSGEDWYQMNVQHFVGENPDSSQIDEKFDDPEVLRRMMSDAEDSYNKGVACETDKKMMALGKKYINYKMELSFDMSSEQSIDMKNSNFDISIKNYQEKHPNTKNIVLNEWFGEEIGEAGFSSVMGYGFLLPIGNAYNCRKHGENGNEGIASDILFAIELTLVEEFSISYDANGGTGEMSDSNLYKKDELATVQDNAFTKEDCTFTGWNTAADGGGEDHSAGGTFPVTGDVTLYAQWEDNSSGSGGNGGSTSKYYSVTYDANGGKGSHQDKSLKKGSTYTVKSDGKTDIHRDGYDFLGWNTKKDGSGTDYDAKDTFSITSNVKLYAQWERDDQGEGQKEIEEPEEDMPARLDTENHMAYIVGYPEGTIKPEVEITRAEVAMVFFRLLATETRIENWSQDNYFSDIFAEDWYNTSISTMVNAGIISGYPEGDFAPNMPITRAEFATMAVRFLDDTKDGVDVFSDISGHWAEDSIKRAAAEGWIVGYEDGTCHPDSNMTRAETMAIMNRMLGRDKIMAEDLHEDMVRWSDNPSDAWYYEAVQEATNSHEYERYTSGGNLGYEFWTDMTATPDWSALNKQQ